MSVHIVTDRGLSRQPFDSPPLERFRYNKSLDGMRGLGIIVVVLAHVGGGVNFGKYSLFGFSVLIDLFFMLSGYLITTLLLEEWSNTSNVSLRNFYVRRFLRLMPPLFVLLGFVVIATVVAKLTGEIYPPFKTTLAEVAAAAFYVYPVILFVKQGEAFLFHLWTLSIEEWFYFLWPAVLVRLGLRRRRPQGVTFAVAGLLAVVVACAAVRIYADTIPLSQIVENGGIGASALVLRLRPESLALGSLLSFFFRIWPYIRTEAIERWATIVTGVAWVGMWIVAVVGPWPPHDGIEYTVWQDLAFRHISYRIAMGLALLGMAHLVLSPDGPIGRLLSSAWLVKVGALSYAIYLWHQPLFMLFKEYVWDHHPFNRGVLFIGVLAVSIGVAELSYRFVEAPSLRQKKRFEAVTYAGKR